MRPGAWREVSPPRDLKWELGKARRGARGTLKDRRSNQAELRRLNMIFPVSGAQRPLSPGKASDRGKEGASLVGFAPPFPWNLRPSQT